MDSFERILKMETTPDGLEATADYLTRLMKPFLSTLEPVLICFPDEGPASLGGIFKEAVLRCEASPVFWGPEYTWKELLRIAFDTHTNTVIGHPRAVLGLMKLSRATGTPLYVYDVIAAGNPFPRWMVNGLKKGLDCRVWGCYAVNSSPLIAGFSCEQEAGIHIREDVFAPYVHTDKDKPLGINRGRLYFASAKDPDLIYDPEQYALLQYQPCSCGCDASRVVETSSLKQGSMSKEKLEETLLTWSSVLDYQARETESGMNLEIVVFPGELLPKLPTCARLTVRNWEPETDVPFFVRDKYLKIPENNS